jgi:hypothetical protein
MDLHEAQEIAARGGFERLDNDCVDIGGDSLDIAEDIRNVLRGLCVKRVGEGRFEIRKGLRLSHVLKEFGHKLSERKRDELDDADPNIYLVPKGRKCKKSVTDCSLTLLIFHK